MQTVGENCQGTSAGISETQRTASVAPLGFTEVRCKAEATVLQRELAVPCSQAAKSGGEREAMLSSSSLKCLRPL